ncbi:MAG TPA: Gfo/Idh/MocA family oxidoreductase [Pirellulales bacterium]|nr:Gfo/Idh/MocA family oxidoreductase [Pirellulales bacterium]
MTRTECIGDESVALSPCRPVALSSPATHGPSRPTPVAVIGAGWVTGARHLPALLASRRCRVLGVVDHRLDRAQALAKRFHLPHAAADLEASWLDEVEAATIGVSPMAHYETASALLRQGKHVLVEKPLCLSVTEGESLVELAERERRVLAVVHNFQFARSVRKAMRLLHSGRWGNLTGLHGMQLSSERRRLPTWYEELPGGLFYDESPHLLYLLRAFGGRIELRQADVTSSPRPRATPATVQAHFDSSCGPATMFMNFEAPVSEWFLFVFAERGMAVIDIFRDVLHFVPNDGRHTARDIARSSWRLLSGHAWGFAASGWQLINRRLRYGNDEVVKRFFDAVQGVAPLRDIDPAAALDVLRLQHAILNQELTAGAERALAVIV